jgi:hypothetical protein
MSWVIDLASLLGLTCVFFCLSFNFDPHSFNCINFFFQFHPLTFDFYIKFAPYSFKCYLFFQFYPSTFFYINSCLHSFQFFFFLFWILFCWFVFLILPLIIFLIGSLASWFFWFWIYGSIQFHDLCYEFKLVDRVGFSYFKFFFKFKFF